MTYSFNPLADIPVDHGGLFIIGMVCVTWMIIVLFNEPEDFFVQFFFVFIVMAISYGVSFHWTDQTPKTFKNEKVVGEFVGYESEGYKERSGKSYVDKHFTYIIYKVDGGNVMLPCQTGVVYPERVTLYKN
jgi:hypothetical protein